MTLIFFPVKAEILYFLKNLVRNFLEFFFGVFFWFEVGAKIFQKKVGVKFSNLKKLQKKTPKNLRSKFLESA